MVLKEAKVLVTSGRETCSVRSETSAVSDMKVTIVHKKTEPAINDTRSKCVEEKKYQGQK